VQLSSISKPKIVFIGSPDFAGRLLSGIIEKELADVCAVWTRRSVPAGRGRKIRESLVINAARSSGIPCYQTDNINDESNCRILTEHRPDIAFVAAFGQIIQPSFYDIPVYGTFNLHFSLLPYLRGASPVQSAILSGAETSGVTIQKICRRLDEGDIALQREFSISGLRAPDVFEISLTESLSLLNDFFSRAPESFQTLTPQNHSIATYCGKIVKTAGKISRKTGSLDALRMFRAYFPIPGTFFCVDGKKFIIEETSEILPADHGRQVGVLYHLNKKRLFLGLTDGVLEIKAIRPENRSPMDSRSFLNGTKMPLPLAIDD